MSRHLEARPSTSTLVSTFTRTSLAALAAASLFTACGVDADGPDPVDEVASEPGAEARPSAPVIFEGVRYAPAEFLALGVRPAHFASTVESARDGYVYAFATADERDRFATEQALSRPGDDGKQSLFKRKESRFYDLTGYSDKVLELDPGEAVLDLSTNPCGCNQDISSIKASEEALFTRVYDLPDLKGDSWSIPSGSEISNLGQYIRSNGQSWDQDISSIELTH
jgi:hypothetical protein